MNTDSFQGIRSPIRLPTVPNSTSRKLPTTQSTGPERKRAKRVLKSKVHTYFKDHPSDINLKICIGCNVAVGARSGNTTSRLRHMKSCPKINPNAEVKNRRNSLARVDSTLRKKDLVNGEVVQDLGIDNLAEREKKADVKYSKNWFLDELVVLMHRKVNLQRRNEFIKYVNLQHEDMKSKIQTIVEKQIVNSSLAVSIDSSSSAIPKAFMKTTLHFVDENFKLKKIPISIERHYGFEDYIANSILLLNILKKWKICQNVVSITTGNNKKFIEAVRILREKLKLHRVEMNLGSIGWVLSPKWHFGCLFEMISQVVKLILNVFEFVVSKAKNFSKFFCNVKRRNDWSRAVKSSISGNSRNTLIPELGVETRWDLIIKMLRMLLKKKSLILTVQEKMLQFDKEFEAVRLLQPDFNGLEVVLQCLEKFESIGLDAAVENEVTCSARKGMFNAFEKSLGQVRLLMNDLVSRNDDETFGLQMRKSFVEAEKKLEEFNCQREIELTSIQQDCGLVQLAQLLDKRIPRSNTIREENFENDVAFLLAQTNLVDLTSFQRIEKLGSSFKVSSYYNSERHKVRSVLGDQETRIKSFLKEPALKDRDDILLYWNARSETYPKLAILARRVLCCPTSCLTGKNAFSFAQNYIPDQCDLAEEELTKALELREWCQLTDLT
eukprot:maker-scaffold_47-snap-gene-1.0-mRNA-1 protein AED:0.21 eAED:0.21 QI:242/1/1/1/1/1/2/204/665